MQYNIYEFLRNGNYKITKDSVLNAIQYHNIGVGEERRLRDLPRENLNLPQVIINPVIDHGAAVVQSIREYLHAYARQHNCSFDELRICIRNNI